MRLDSIERAGVLSIEDTKTLIAVARAAYEFLQIPAHENDITQLRNLAACLEPLLYPVDEGGAS